MLECRRLNLWGVFSHIALLSCLVVVTAIGLGPHVVAGGYDASTNEVNVTGITECTEIEEPGEYVLANDIEGTEDSPCIEIIGADSVVLEGQGFTISNARVGVDIHRSSNVTVKNLNVDGTKRHGIGLWNSETVEIHGNTVSDTGSAPVWHNNSIHSWKSTNVKIYNNTVSNSSNYGIYTGRTSGGNIYRNKVINAEWSIFSAESTDLRIHENHIENPDTNGNAIAGTHIINVTVTNNYINDTRYGIEAKPNSTDVVIRDNVIKNTVLCSIEAEGHDPGEYEGVTPGSVSDVVIEDNYMENTGPLGVWVNTSNIIVKNNTVNNASGLGMYIRGIDGTVEIYENTFTNSRSAAIRINDTREHLHIYDNDFRQLGTGLRLLNTADIRIEGNRFTDVRQPFEEQNTSGIKFNNNTVVEEAPAESTTTPTPTPTLTPTPSPTPTQTEAEPEIAEGGDEAELDTQSSPTVQETTETSGQSGFGIVVAAIAIVVTGLLSNRRRGEEVEEEE